MMIDALGFVLMLGVYPIEYQQSTSLIGVPLRVPNRPDQQ
jgi:hypothetical protein